jgi:hypothetical protein
MIDARQTKFWVADPDRMLWEVYLFHEGKVPTNAETPLFRSQRSPRWFFKRSKS